MLDIVFSYGLELVPIHRIRMNTRKCFFSPEVPEAPAKKTGFNLMIVHFYIRRKLDIIRC